MSVKQYFTFLEIFPSCFLKANRMVYDHTFAHLEAVTSRNARF
jgi:hypothetical protein